MAIRKFCYILTIFLLVVFSAVCSCGCISDDRATVLEDDDIVTSNIVLEDTKPNNDYLDEENPDIDLRTYTASIKKTGVMELDNGYSLKVLNIDKQEKQIMVSLRKDGNEYDTKTMFEGSAYRIKDTTNINAIYTVHVDSILDNSFIVELTCVIKPEISQETEIYEGKTRLNEVRINEDTITRTYRWNYEDTDFVVAYEYNIKAYDTYSERSRIRDYPNFVSDPYDDELISQITAQIEKLAEEAGYTNNDVPYITMAFVQSLPYVSDSASAGYDDYTRFPFETLYHGGGDCEDSSILLAALLSDMEYGVALIELPGHMAVGIKGDSSFEGSYYEYSGTRYYYLETTNSNWAVGVIPKEYTNSEAIVVPILEGYPELRIDFSGTAKSNGILTYANLEIEVENVGSSVAEDLIIYASLESTTENMVWDDLKTDTNSDLDVEESLTYTVSDLSVPVGEKYRVGIWAWGSNVEVKYVHSDWMIA
ncbi:MAG: hypothetical protein RBT65_10980 [Methanolobus sp.]|nr:hypothetical protein [Methanolobus sp.]